MITNAVIRHMHISTDWW